MRVDEDTRFRMMRLIEADPNISQRRIARELGISVGAVNYCLNALIEKGLVKIENFRASSRKLSYIYMLTPKGVSEKAGLTRGFLLRKMAEYEAAEGRDRRNPRTCRRHGRCSGAYECTVTGADPTCRYASACLRRSWRDTCWSCRFDQ